MTAPVPSDVPTPPAPQPGNLPGPLPPGLRWALLAHPAVQLVRFGTKLALAWFLLPEAFGRAFLAGSLAFAAGHLALLGLDEAWVATRHPGPRLDGAVARLHLVSGAAAAALTALAGWALRVAMPGDGLGLMVASLAPMVFLANLAVLPTARLVREQDWPRLFALDLVAVISLSITTLGAAALGAGSWSLVLGWTANALATLALAASLVRAHPLPAQTGAAEDDIATTRRRGLHLYGAQLSGFLGERLDGWFVAFGLGPASLSIFGLYEKAQYMGGVLVGWAGQLSERALFPALSARHRLRRLAPAFGAALRAGLVWLAPAHVALALLARPLVALLLPPAWLDTAPLLVLMSLAGGARCLDVIATTALKASDRSRAVAALGVARLGLLAAALLAALPTGNVIDLARAVLAARLLAAGLSLGWALTRVATPRAPLLRALATLALFVALALPARQALAGAFGPGSPWLLLTGAASLAALWLLVRRAIDRDSLHDDFTRVRGRLARSAREAGA